jgi:hypothetical protein
VDSKRSDGQKECVVRVCMASNIIGLDGICGFSGKVVVLGRVFGVYVCNCSAALIALVTPSGIDFM